MKRSFPNANPQPLIDPNFFFASAANFESGASLITFSNAAFALSTLCSFSSASPTRKNASAELGL